MASTSLEALVLDALYTTGLLSDDGNLSYDTVLELMRGFVQEIGLKCRECIDIALQDPLAPIALAIAIYLNRTGQKVKIPDVRKAIGKLLPSTAREIALHALRQALVEAEHE